MTVATAPVDVLVDDAEGAVAMVAEVAFVRWPFWVIAF